MLRYDRLSALIARFTMRVSPARPGSGNLLIFGDAAGRPTRVALRLRGSASADRSVETMLIEAEATWGGDANPLLAALPDGIDLPVDDEETAALVRLLLSEARAGRCGSAAVLSRLAEVLVVRLLRTEIGRGAAAPGLVAGLADPRLSRAIVAMHEEPGRAWSNAALAEVAGMSLSRFADGFRSRVGETPMTYLRRWRMTLARQDLDGGHRVQAVARRYGYGSTEALARAFQRHYGVNPRAVRQAAARPGSTGAAGAGPAEENASTLPLP